MTILNTIKLTAISMIASSLLVGCGSSSSNTSNVLQSTVVKFFGIASDPELQGANVYVDVNENATYDEGELNTTTDVNGSYTLDIPKADLGKPVIVEGGIDAVTKEAFTGQLSMVAEELQGNENITPLTTLVKEYKDENPTMSLDDIKAELATKLDISTDDLDKDTTAAGNEALLQVALQVQKVVELIADASSQVDVNDTYASLASQLKTQDDLNSSINATIDATADLSDLAKAKAKDLSDELSKLNLDSGKEALALSVEKINDTVDKVTTQAELYSIDYDSLKVTTSDEIQTQVRDAIYKFIGLDDLSDVDTQKLNDIFSNNDFDFSDATPQDVADKINDDTFMGINGTDTDFNTKVRASLNVSFSASGSIDSSL